MFKQSLCRDFPDLNQVVYEGAEENNHLLRVRDCFSVYNDLTKI